MFVHLYASACQHCSVPREFTVCWEIGKDSGFEFWLKVLISSVTLDKWWDLMSLGILDYKIGISPASLGSVNIQLD